MKKFYLVFIVAAVVLVASGAAARRHVRRNSFTPYTVTWRVTDYDATGLATFRYTETHAASSSGSWHAVKDYADGRRDESFAEPGRGVFVIREDRMHYLSAVRDAPSGVTMEKLRASSQFVREDMVAGIPVAVMRIPPPQPGAAIVEMWIAPSLNGEAIKYVTTDYPGTNKQRVNVTEPIALELGEPDPVKLSHPERPVDTTNYQKIHGGN